LKTSELFAEQVLIGLVVLSVVGLVFYDHVQPFFESDSKVLQQVVAAGFIIGAAYLIGMVYDRVADTLLQDLESHGRIKFALRDFKIKGSKVDRYLVPSTDPFEEGKHRILVLGNGQATDHMEYLRSRIRLTRALATLIPAIMVSFLLALEPGKASRGWKAIAVTIPVVYAATFLTKVMKRWKLFERPPKTYELADLRTYMHNARMLQKSPLRPKHILWLLVKDEVWIGLLLLAIAASILILTTRSYARFSILLLGIAFTLIVGWSWWRISGTFYSFLRDYQKYASPEAKIQRLHRSEGISVNYFLDWKQHAGSQADKFYKTTLWQGEHVMIGLNCLEPGQTQKVHAHDGADKFYLVLEGHGEFTVGEEKRDADTGSLVVAPAGIPHGVSNTARGRLSLLVTIAPPFK
jgi:quercetin dioxygenase-like cupin family protein